MKKIVFILSIMMIFSIFGIFQSFAQDKITGYVAAEGVAAVTDFTVEIPGTAISTVSDSKGYFEITNPGPSTGCTIRISRNGYLTRNITNVLVSGNAQVSTADAPLYLCAGDMNQDASINMSDVILIATVFNSTKGDAKYSENYDLNMDGSINMKDIILLAVSFNKIPSSYPNVNVVPVSSTPSATPTTKPSDPVPDSKFVKSVGTNFYLDGKKFYFGGCNTYDLFTYGDGSNISTQADIESKFMNKVKIDEMMSNMQKAGITVLRTWGFSNEKWHGFETARGVYSEPQFMLFDYIMDSARRHGIKVIITLENYWEAYGGIDQKLKWEGLPAVSHANRAKFFTNKNCKDYYKKYVKFFVERINYFSKISYKDDPTIFAWDLMNEPRYQDAGENSTGTTLRAWIDEMAGYIKSLDSNHMVCAGIEGHESKYGFGGDEGNPFVYIQQSPYIDFCIAHPHPDEPWANLTPEQNAKLTQMWIDDAHLVVKKPFIIGEFNTHNKKEAYWSTMIKVLEDSDAAGLLFWEFNFQRISNLSVLPSDPIMKTVFEPYAARMKEKCK